MEPFSQLNRAEQASCFRAGSKEETREALQETEVQVLLVRLHGARPSLPCVNSGNEVSSGFSHQTDALPTTGIGSDQTKVVHHDLSRESSVAFVAIGVFPKPCVVL